MHRNKIIPIQTNSLSVSPTEPLLIDLVAAGRMISSPVSTIRRLIRQQHLKPILLGKKFLIDPADLRALIARSKIGGAA
jgi:hypothetical protein